MTYTVASTTRLNAGLDKQGSDWYSWMPGNRRSSNLSPTLAESISKGLEELRISIENEEQGPPEPPSLAQTRHGQSMRPMRRQSLLQASPLSERTSSAPEGALQDAFAVQRRRRNSMQVPAGSATIPVSSIAATAHNSESPVSTSNALSHDAVSATPAEGSSVAVAAGAALAADAATGAPATDAAGMSRSPSGKRRDSACPWGQQSAPSPAFRKSAKSGTGPLFAAGALAAAQRAAADNVSSSVLSEFVSETIVEEDDESVATDGYSSADTASRHSATHRNIIKQPAPAQHAPASDAATPDATESSVNTLPEASQPEAAEQAVQAVHDLEVGDGAPALPVPPPADTQAQLQMWHLEGSSWAIMEDIAEEDESEVRAALLEAEADDVPAATHPSVTAAVTVAEPSGVRSASSSIAHSAAASDASSKPVAISGAGHRTRQASQEDSHRSSPGQKAALLLRAQDSMRARTLSLDSASMPPSARGVHPHAVVAATSPSSSAFATPSLSGVEPEVMVWHQSALSSAESSSRQSSGGSWLTSASRRAMPELDTEASVLHPMRTFSQPSMPVAMAAQDTSVTAAQAPPGEGQTAGGHVSESAADSAQQAVDIDAGNGADSSSSGAEGPKNIALAAANGDGPDPLAHDDSNMIQESAAVHDLLGVQRMGLH